MSLRKFGDLWYFFAFSRDGANTQSNDAASPESFDSGVVSTITSEQAEPGTQDMISTGILGGGYHQVVVDGVQMGDRTATVDVTLSGGKSPSAKGRLVCISKSEAGTTYWFVARFEKR